MSIKSIFLFCLAITYAGLWASAQDKSSVSSKPELALEARITTYLQGGYDLGALYYPKGTKWSFGFLVARHDITGITKEWLFDSNNHDALDMRLNWIASFLSRYHFAAHKEGFFAELGLGIEEFRVSAGAETFSNTNGFIAPAIGYIWYPWGRSGFYLMPKVNGVLTLFRADEQTMAHGTTFRLKPFFATPSFSIGWKF
ncbi:hypothetical protein [Chitinophaga japonensis]|uniref:DUF3575 domain-containing protein n=1 Tax=Chitinophaga japonensis TaxID=104662 RepID=A0A562SIZ9_CHIJA|nr:hypothetical protein [Chitinophaga japonensis]TWI80964.1 hypothetical protein LX66_5569 [Chitinophaga japonensis]